MKSAECKSQSSIDGDNVSFKVKRVLLNFSRKVTSLFSSDSYPFYFDLYTTKRKWKEYKRFLIFLTYDLSTSSYLKKGRSQRIWEAQDNLTNSKRHVAAYLFIFPFTLPCSLATAVQLIPLIEIPVEHFTHI